MTAFHLTVATPQGKAFDGDVVNVSLRGTLGDLAIMAGHIPFTTSICAGVCTVLTDEQTKKTAQIGEGVLVVSADGTRILTDRFQWEK